MERRTLLAVLVGVLILGGIALVLSPELIDGGEVACSVGFGDVGEDEFGCQGNRTTILGVRLSDTEVVVWGTILGAALGVALGLIGDRLTRPASAGATV